MAVVISSGYSASQPYLNEAWKPIALWKSVLTTGNLSVTAAADDFPLSNILTPATAELWKGVNTSNVEFVAEGINDNYTAGIGIARHNFGTGNIAYEVFEKVGSGDSWVQVLSDHTPAPGDRKPILVRLERKIRYGLRIIVKPSSVIPEIGVLMIGDLLVFEHGIPPGHTPINYAWNRDRTTSIATSGDYLGSVTVTEGLQTSIQQVDLDPDHYRNMIEPFRVGAETFFWGWSPLIYPDEVGYCWFINDPQPVISQKTGNINITFNVAGIDA